MRIEDVRRILDSARYKYIASILKLIRVFLHLLVSIDISILYYLHGLTCRPYMYIIWKVNCEIWRQCHNLHVCTIF